MSFNVGTGKIMTNKFSKLALATTALFALGLGATSATAAPASVNAVAKAKVLKQLTIVKVSDIDFGTIVTGTAASTVVVDAAGARTCGTGLTCTAAASAAKFTVTGSNNTAITVTVPATVTLAGGGGTMVATLAAPTTLTLDNSGSTGNALNFGGSLAVGANQADGVYTSPNFAVTVNYQ